jgi:hypothetical protein
MFERNPKVESLQLQKWGVEDEGGFLWLVGKRIPILHLHGPDWKI